MSDVRILASSAPCDALPDHYEDMTGRRFGHLTAIRPIPSRALTRMRVRWECRCDCGGWETRSAASLKAMKHPERAHCQHCDGGPRIDWDNVLVAQKDLIDNYRAPAARSDA